MLAVLLLISFRLRPHFFLGSALAALLASGCARKNFFQPDALPPSALPLPAAADSVHGATAGRHYARHGRLYGALVGQHHRRTWAAPVAAPIFHLADARPGGLRAGKVGGGFNSTSLGLTDADGRAYVLRTVDKDPVRAMPQWLRGTFLVNVLRDNVSSTNPYGALAVPPLAEAVGVPHTSPRLYYVRPDDAAFRSDSLLHFRGQLAYLEEKAAVLANASDSESHKTVNSQEAFAAIFKGFDQRIDQPALLRARLLDAWMGDWDRHAGQWNWAVSRPASPAANTTISPLPKDRDMVFYRLDDGGLGWLIGHAALRHWTTFAPRYARTADLFSNGNYLDVRGLNGLTRAQFRATAQAMQQQLTDAVISEAVRRLPPTALALEGARLMTALQARRAVLPALADKFYRQLARKPMLGGSAQADIFQVHRYVDSTVVTVRGGKAASLAAAPQYQRAFYPAETQVIQLEGLGGDDVFLVEEHGPKPASRPKIRIYGGPGNDELRAPKTSMATHFIQGSNKPGRAYDELPEE